VDSLTKSNVRENDLVLCMFVKPQDKIKVCESVAERTLLKVCPRIKNYIRQNSGRGCKKSILGLQFESILTIIVLIMEENEILCRCCFGFNPLKNTTNFFIELTQSVKEA
jgi:hypothetical protein